MPVRHVEFHPDARLELLEARDWYANRSEEVALRFAKAVQFAIEMASRMPERCQGYRAGTKCLTVRGFPYLIVFRHTEKDTISVLAVAHGRRRPTYWKRRDETGS